MGRKGKPFKKPGRNSLSLLTFGELVFQILFLLSKLEKIISISRSLLESEEPFSKFLFLFSKLWKGISGLSFFFSKLEKRISNFSFSSRLNFFGLSSMTGSTANTSSSYNVLDISKTPISSWYPQAIPKISPIYTPRYPQYILKINPR